MFVFCSCLFVAAVHAATNDFHELRVNEGGREATECGLTPHNESHGGSPLREYSSPAPNEEVTE